MVHTPISGLTDVHCHILPYVDDGAQNLAEAQAMLEMQKSQGVKTIYCTPHLRQEMFETPQEKVDEKFVQLEEIATEMQMKLFLSREYHCDEGLLQLLHKEQIRPLADGVHVLIEFSNRHCPEDIFRYLAAVKAVGLVPVIAHIERYDCLLQEPFLVDQLIQKGAWTQMNTSAILGKEGWKRKLFCKKILKRDQVYLIGSDAHHADWRVPNMGECAKFLHRKLSEEQINRLLFQNPVKLQKECVSVK